MLGVITIPESENHLHYIKISIEKRHYRLQKVSNAFLVFKIIYLQTTWSI